MSTSLREQVLKFATSKIGKTVGTGECWDLAELALSKGTNGKAKTSYDYGTVTKTADYIWGKPVDVNKAQPGDILQFKGHQATIYRERNVTIFFPDKSNIQYGDNYTRTFTRGHHTAIVYASLSGNIIKVLEQHVMRGGTAVETTVGEGKIFVNDQSPATLNTQETIKITNQWGSKVRALNTASNYQTFVDQIVKKYEGRSFLATVKTIYWVKAKAGTISAYTPEPRGK